MNKIIRSIHQLVLALFSIMGIGLCATPVLAEAQTEAASAVPQTTLQAEGSAQAKAGDQTGAPESPAATTPTDAPAEAAVGRVYMLVNGKPITVREYNQRLTYTLKNKYYHGRVPEGKEEETRKELTDEMVNHILLLEDAEKRGFKPDEAKIQQVLASEAAKNRNKPAWLQQRDMLEAQLKTLVGQKSLLEQLEAAVKDVPEPTPAEVQNYYEQHLDLFTEPEKLRLSVILLKVDPSLPVDEWKQAYDEAQKLADQIKAGADFAELARKYSGDKSAKNGGDMGYLHRGMVPAAIQEGVDKFVVGEVSAPYKGLEGMSVFRLEDRLPAKKMEFKQVEERAKGLLMRDKRDLAWKSNLERLRSEAKLEVVTQPITLPGTSLMGQ
jgi:parvulin-like peptidyl-prolyl isomerase